jgi:hypothetical protein
MEKFKKEYIIAFIATSVTIFVCFFANYKYERRTVVNCKDSIVVKHDTIFAEKEEDETIIVKPLPAITKYKVTDWVCAWGRWSGVVREIKWSTRVPNTLVYTVQHYSEEEGFYENGYVDTELELGKCK